MKNRNAYLVATLFVAVAVFSRLAPHPLNFSPVAGVALFSGAFLSTGLAAAVILGSLMISDLILGLHFTMPFTWASFLAVMWLGRPLAGAFRPAQILLRAFAGSAFFFVVTNFGVFLEGRMYARTWNGLAECYWMALPFYRNTVAGDLAFALILFGAWHLAVGRRAAAPQPAGLENR